MHELVYVAAAVVVLGELAYRIARGEPVTRVSLGGAAVAVASLIAYAVVQQYVPIGAQRIEASFQALNASYTCIADTVSSLVATIDVASSISFTAALILAPFTLGTSAVLAMAAIEAVVDAVNKYVQSMGWWLGQAAATLLLVKVSVELAPVIYASLVPLVAALAKSRRGAFVAAYFALAPWLIAAAAYMIPQLQPMSACGAEFPPIPHGSALVWLNSTQPTIFVLKTKYGDWNATWIAEGPTQTLLPPGQYDAYAVWMFAKVPVAPPRFSLKPQNASAVGNSTYYVAVYNESQVVVKAVLPKYDEVYGWSYAVSPAPHGRDWVVVEKIPRLRLAWHYTYSCYGYASGCPVETHRISGVGLFWYVESKKSVDYASVSIRPSIADADAVSPQEWSFIRSVSQGAVPPYPSYNGTSGPKTLSVDVAIKPEPHIVCEWVNGTQVCREEPVHHYADVYVYVVLYATSPEPQNVVGFYAQKNKTAYTIFDVMQVFNAFKNAVSPALAAGSLVYETLIEPAAWVAGTLVPWLLLLAYYEILVLLSAAGVGIILAADAVLPRLIHFEELMRNIEWHFDPFRHGFRMLARGLSSPGASPAAPVTASVTEQAVKSAAESAVKLADMAKLYAATAIKAGLTVYYGDLLDLGFAAGGIAALVPHAWREAVGSNFRLARTLGSAVHKYFSPGSDLFARRVHELLFYVNMAARLRFDALSAVVMKYFREAYEHNLALFGNKYTALGATLWYGRALTPTEAAAFALVSNMPSRRFEVVPKALAEELKWRFGVDVTDEEALRRWLKHTGSDERVVDLFLALADKLGVRREEALTLAAAAHSLPPEFFRLYASAVPDELLPVLNKFVPGLGEEEAGRRFIASLANAPEVDKALFSSLADSLSKSRDPLARALADLAKDEMAAGRVEAAWELLREAAWEHYYRREAAKGYDVIVHISRDGRVYAYVTYGGSMTREDVLRLKERGYVITGEAWGEFGGVPPTEAPLLKERGRVDVNPYYLAWRDYTVEIEDNVIRVDFGGDKSIEDVLDAVLKHAGELEGTAAPAVKRLIESGLVGKALVEYDHRQEVERNIAHFFSSAAPEEKAAATELISEVAERLRAEQQAQPAEQLKEAQKPQEREAPQQLTQERVEEALQERELPSKQMFEPLEEAPRLDLPREAQQEQKQEERAAQAFEQPLDLPRGQEQQIQTLEEPRAPREREEEALRLVEEAQLPKTQQLLQEEAQQTQLSQEAARLEERVQDRQTQEYAQQMFEREKEEQLEAREQQVPERLDQLEARQREAPPQHEREERRVEEVAEALREKDPAAALVYEVERKYGIDISYDVAAKYAEKYGEEAEERVVRDYAKELAAAYRVPFAEEEVEQLVKKYGAEEAARLLAQAKELAKKTGEDVRDVLRKF